MVWRRIAGLVGVLAVLTVIAGGVLSLATNGLFAGATATAAGAVLVLVGVVVVGMVLVGRRSRRHTYNPDYYW